MNSTTIPTRWETVADMKRSLIAGAIVLVDNLAHPALSGQRTVLRAQTQRMCLSFPEGHDMYKAIPDGDGDGSWLDFPKAKGVRFEDGKAVLLDGGSPWLILSMVAS